MAVVKTRNYIVLRNYARGGVALLIFMILLFSKGCGGKDNSQSQKKKAPLVVVEAVKEDVIVRTLDLTGEIVSIEMVEISSMLEGPIVFFPWREGDYVKAGQKLVEIEREIYKAEVKAAEAALMVAEAKLIDMREGTRPEEIEKARQSVREAEQNAVFEKGDFERISQLVDSGALPGEELEKSRVKLTAAEAKMTTARQHLEMLEKGYTNSAIAVQQALVKEASAKLDLAKARFRECLINAPFSGTITKVFVRQGDMAAPKTPLLTLTDLSSLVFRSTVPEFHAAEVHNGMKAEVRIDALPGKVLNAEIARVYPELDPRMRTRTIELIVHDDVTLVPGMFGRARLILESISNAITVPVQSILVTPIGDQMAFVAENGKVVQRKVQTGIEQGGRIQILSGLKLGETVIVSGQEKLKNGIDIRLPSVPGEIQSDGKISSREESSQ